MIDLGIPGASVKELARWRGRVIVLLSRRTPEHVSGYEVCSVDVALLHGFSAWLLGWAWWLFRVKAQDVEVPDPSGDGVCHTRQIVKKWLARVFADDVTYCHVLHSLGELPELPRRGAVIDLDVSLCRVLDAGREVTFGPDRLDGRRCPHVVIHSAKLAAQTGGATPASA